MLCDFEDLDEAQPAVEHRFRCRRCGAERQATAGHPLRRQCAREVDDVGELVLPGRDRGFGDTLARWLSRWGIAKRPGCGCSRRQSWLNRVWPYALSAPRGAAPWRFSFPHGLGDTVQLTIVLRHLRELRPDWQLEIVSRPGAASLLEGLGYRVLADADQPAIPLAWPEPESCYTDSPSTKAERVLREAFGITPREEWCRYEIRVTPRDRQAAERYLRGLAPRRKDGRFPVVALHYQGNSAVRAKDLDERLVGALVRQVRDAGYVPLLLDWDWRSGLLEMSDVANPGAGHALWDGASVGDGRRLAALIDSCALFVGIDSGPGHVAGATTTPSLIVWRGHHPVNYYAQADHVTHLVPHDHARHLRGDRAVGESYFHRRYRHRVYQNLRTMLPLVVEEMLAPAGTVLAEGDVWVRREHRAADLTIVRDVVHDDCYRVAEWPAAVRRVLDVGSHLGALGVRVRQVFPVAEVVGVDPDPAHAEVWRRNNPPSARRLEVACSQLTEAVLRSSVVTGTHNTGASRVEPPGDIAGPRVATRSLAALLDELGWDRCDVLKLDCEGCEMDALADQAGLARCGLVVGEWHDWQVFLERVAQLPEWRLVVLREGPLGLFRLERRPVAVEA